MGVSCVFGSFKRRIAIVDGSKTGAFYVYKEPIDSTAIAIGVPMDNGRSGSAYLFDSTPQSWVNIYLPLITR